MLQTNGHNMCERNVKMILIRWFSFVCSKIGQKYQGLFGKILQVTISKISASKFKST